MKLSYLSGTPIPSRAASALHVVKMCNALAKMCAVTVYGLRGDDEDLAAFYACDIEFDYCGFEHSIFPGAGYRFALRTFLKERNNRASVYYGRHLNALWLTAKLGVPFAYEAHAMPRTGHARMLLRNLVSHPNCRGVVCITELLADELQGLLPRSDLTRVLPDAADIPQPSDGLSSDVSNWPGRSNAPQIGYVGHLYPGKGVEMIYALAESSPQWDFHIVGGRDEDIATWQARKKLPNLFYHGFVKHGALAAYYRLFDVALLPLQPKVWIADKKGEIGSWTSPIKAFEYMAHRLPVVASDTPALAEIFEHRKTALMVESQDLKAWQLAINEIVSDRKFAEQLVDSAWQMFAANHTWKHRASAVVDLLS